MKIEAADRSAAAKIYTGYRNAFLQAIKGTLTKDLLVRDEDVQVLHDQDCIKKRTCHKMFFKTTFVARSNNLLPYSIFKILTPAAVLLIAVS
ncbi:MULTISPECIES: hypothetical protein [Sporomusa]|uniref:hypothetical protein n=1 Tax=Sporomusa TaxID=2375 RepID=UPI003158C2BC